ncbi:MAG: phosphodiester glycosidase family protein [Firmicutes bacterium]|nr:phosphodiester glycosidase family protein [Bacillota bacterium]
MKGKNRLLKVYAILLAAFTVFTALDTFVLTKTYEVVETVSEEVSQQESYAGSISGRRSKDRRTASSGSVTGQSGKAAGTGTTLVTEDSYTDGNISVSLSEYEYSDTAVYVAKVELSSPEYLKTAFANNTYGKNITAATSDIAETAGAILAINGDYYGVQEKGYVLRNGVLYRSSAVSGKEDLVIYEDGSFEIINESDVSAEELLEKGAVQILSFGPALVEDGEVSVNVSDEVGRAKASNSRTAIAVTEDGSYLFIVSDGRTDESEGLSLYELAEFAKSLGAETAYNLDGGGSSTMVFNGTVVNNPTSSGSIKERKVSDIVYIGY